MITTRGLLDLKVRKGLWLGWLIPKLSNLAGGALVIVTVYSRGISRMYPISRGSLPELDRSWSWYISELLLPSPNCTYYSVLPNRVNFSCLTHHKKPPF